MAKLQRPATLKEFVIQSLLGWRDPDPTLVDREDDSPTALLRRAPSSAPPPAPTPRDTLSSYVFDLRVVPRVASSPSDPELARDTLPSPPPVMRSSPSIRREPSVPRGTPVRRERSGSLALQPVSTRGAWLARTLLLALVVLAAALASAGAARDVVRAGGARAPMHAH